MSWLFSRALVAEYSAENFSDGELCAPLSVMPTQHKFWHNDKMTEPSNLSRYGLTCEVLTDTRGEELLISYLAGFRVKTSALPEADADWTEHGRGFGEKWRGSSAKYDPNMSSWKIRRFSLLGEEIELLETLPRWGMTVNGELSERTMPTLHTSVTGYGSSRHANALNTQDTKQSESLFDEIESNEDLSHQEFFYTPKANDAEKRGNVSADKRNGIVGQVMNFYRTPQSSNGAQGPKSAKLAQECLETGKSCINLVDQVAMINRGLWPTPQARDFRSGEGHRWQTPEKRSRNLNDAVAFINGHRLFPTPIASQHKGAGSEASMYRKDGKPRNDRLDFLLEPGQDGRLNPNWVEWLMGWPIGHTDLKPLETDKLAEWYRWHGVS